MAERRYPLPPSLNGESLAEELNAAGFAYAHLIADGEELEVVVPDGADLDALDRVVAAHTGGQSQAEAQRAAADPQKRIAELEAAVDLLILDSLTGA